MYIPNSMVVADIIVPRWLKMSVYASPNPKHPLSRAEGCDQFCYRDEDCFSGLSRAVFIVIDQIHYAFVPPGQKWGAVGTRGLIN